MSPYEQTKLQPEIGKKVKNLVNEYFTPAPPISNGITIEEAEGIGTKLGLQSSGGYEMVNSFSNARIVASFEVHRKHIDFEYPPD